MNKELLRTLALVVNRGRFGPYRAESLDAEYTPGVAYIDEEIAEEVVKTLAAQPFEQIVDALGLRVWRAEDAAAIEPVYRPEGDP